MKAILNKKYFLGVLAFVICSSAFAQGSGGFVTLENGKFVKDGAEWYPVGVNYSVTAKVDFNNQYFIGRAADYLEPTFPNGTNNAPDYNPNCCVNKDDCRDSLLADFQRIKSKGFNCIRVPGLAFGGKDNYPSIGLYNLSYPWPIGVGNISTLPPYTLMFDMIDELLDVAEDAGLKVQLIVGGEYINSLEEIEVNGQQISKANLFISYLQAVAAEFSDNPTLWSYDFMNEPGDTDNYSSYSKGKTCEFVDLWNTAVKSNCNQLTTIGLQGSRDTYEWDPHFLKVDFLSHHLYGGGTTYAEWVEDVRREIRWIAETSRVPWIIGETGYPVSNDPFYDCTAESGSCQDANLINPTLAEQADFAEVTLRTVRDYGGIGYTWWQYSDVHWEPGFGLVHRDGAQKPVFDMFSPSEFDPFAYEGYDNVTNAIYYKHVGNPNHVANGYIVDWQGNAVENALIQKVGDDKNTFTFSRPDGGFTLHSSNNIGNIKATGPGTSFAEAGWPGWNMFVIRFAPDEFLTVNVTVPYGQYPGPGRLLYQATNMLTVGPTDIIGNGVDGPFVHFKGEQRVELKEGFRARKGSDVFISNDRAQYSCGAYDTDDYIKPDAEDEWKSLVSGGSKKDKVIRVQANGVTVHPNPSNGIFSVKTTNEDMIIYKVEVYNHVGNKISERNERSQDLTIDISEQASGLYILRIYSNEGVGVERVILE